MRVLQEHLRILFCEYRKNISESFNVNAANRNCQQYLVQGSFVNFFKAVISADETTLLFPSKNKAGDIK